MRYYKKYKMVLLMLAFVLALFLCGCEGMEDKNQSAQEEKSKEESTPTVIEETTPSDTPSVVPDNPDEQTEIPARSTALEVTDTPVPTFTPLPTDTPTPTVTPLPTNTPTPMPTNTPTPEPSPTPIPRAVTGALDWDKEGLYVYYVVNINTKKFHNPNCRAVKQMHQENTNYATDNGFTSRDEAKGWLTSHGYDSCGICNP